ncbi:MAG: hypothetical protein CMJ78_00410 [Planctomycetaceae bacterium]|nr:hypothetical protein [Planctomycetaceae bacterium]
MDRGWFLFRGFVVNNRSLGNPLSIGGVNLESSRIAVAAFDAQWYFDEPLEHPGSLITSSLGNLQEVGNDALFKFSEAPRYSIVVRQQGGPAVPVSSNTRFTPQIINLRDDRPIFVQVNERRNRFANNMGTFSMWVKLLG